MLDHVGRRRPVILQHVLDQVDAAARRIELVAQQHIGRTGRGAEAAMDAGAQDLVGFRGGRIGKLSEREMGLHDYTPAHMRPGLRMPLGSKLSFTRLVRAATPSACGSNTSTAARMAAGARINVAWPPAWATDATDHLRTGIARFRDRDPDQAAGPVEEIGPAGRPPRSFAPRTAPCVGAVDMRHTG